MEVNKLTDNIISSSKGIRIALIGNIQEDDSIPFHYKAIIVENYFPQDLIDAINAFWECVDAFSMILADDFEDEISKYDLRLEQNNTKIFCLNFKEDYITFFTKFPTSKSFIDDYPKE